MGGIGKRLGGFDDGVLGRGEIEGDLVEVDDDGRKSGAGFGLFGKGGEGREQPEDKKRDRFD